MCISNTCTQFLFLTTSFQNFVIFEINLYITGDLSDLLIIGCKSYFGSFVSLLVTKRQSCASTNFFIEIYILFIEKIQGKYFFRSFINLCVFITVWVRLLYTLTKNCDTWITQSYDYGELNFLGFHCFKKFRLCLVPEIFEGKRKEKKIVRKSKKERKKDEKINNKLYTFTNSFNLFFLFYLKIK